MSNILELDKKINELKLSVDAAIKKQSEPQSETLQMEFDDLRKEIKEIKSLLLNKAPQVNSGTDATNQFIMMNKQLGVLIERKDTQIANQAKFEKAWRNTKKAALIVIVLSSLVGIIDIGKDSEVVLDRTLKLVDSVAQAMK